MSMNRRSFLHTGVAATAATFLGSTSARAATAAEAVEQAHREMWRRFIDPYGIMLDFTGLDGKVSLPTPEECREGKPNALGWWSPIENGAMFNGMYMDGAVNRWAHTKADEDAAKARKLMEGLLLLASVSEVKGFVGRGVSTDGKSHFPMGSNDQTLPWFYGLWRYLESGLATPAERTRIVEKLVVAAEAIVALGWQMPAEAPFRVRGGFNGKNFDGVARRLFVARMMYGVTGEKKWESAYLKDLGETGSFPDQVNRLEVCKRGMVFDYARYHSWTSCASVAALRCLWEMEGEPEVRVAYERGLQASADLAVRSLATASKFNVEDPAKFDPDWRSAMMPRWRPQENEKDAEDVAHEQLVAFLKVSPRRGRETEFVREPCAAAWVVSLAPNRDVLKLRAPMIEKVITHFDYSKLYYSQFFWLEGAWWRLVG